MLVRSRGFEPVVAPSVFVAPTAVLVGRIRVDERSRVMYGAVLDSEGSRIEVGECGVICENTILRATLAGDGDYPVLLGDHVFVGPHATLLGCKVEPCSYIATGATVLHGATIGSGAAVAVGALVHANTVIPGEMFVPPNTIAVGDPVEIYQPGDEGLADAIKAVGFAKSAFGTQAGWEDRLVRYRDATEARSEEFGVHMNDAVVEE